MSSFVKQLRLESNAGQARYADWLAELIRADAAPPEPDDGAERRALLAKAAKFGEAPPGYWDSACLHSTPQRFRVDTFRTLIRGELEDIAASGGRSFALL